MELIKFYIIASYFIGFGTLVEVPKITTGYIISFILSPVTILVIIGMKINKP